MTTPGLPTREGYSMGYGDDAHRHMSTRTALAQADFLLPHLRPGMRLLDVGCGPGSISLDLAEAVAPGEVVGVDIENVQIERARALVAERGVTNVRFQEGNAYNLPFEDSTFDVVWAHALLQHLGDPVRALREFRRVLRPGGMTAVRDPDWGLRAMEPATELLGLAQVMRVRVYEHNGGSPTYARNQRGLLIDAGFAHAETYPVMNGFGTLEGTRRFARRMYEDWQAFADTIVAQGWMDSPTVVAVGTELLAWGERPGASAAFVGFCSIGWVDRLA